MRQFSGSSVYIVGILALIMARDIAVQPSLAGLTSIFSV
jgi:hypothetical protein